jgi:hypothetical protein
MLVTEAVRRREEQQSGRSMGRQLRLVAGCALAGVLLIASGGYLGRAVGAAALVAGVLVIAVAGLLLMRALDLSPATQWGEPAAEPCPACGEHGLREDRVAVPNAYGIVALCAAECGYAEVSPDPHGPAEPAGNDARAYAALALRAAGRCLAAAARQKTGMLP